MELLLKYPRLNPIRQNKFLDLFLAIWLELFSHLGKRLHPIMGNSFLLQPVIKKTEIISDVWKKNIENFLLDLNSTDLVIIF